MALNALLVVACEYHKSLSFFLCWRTIDASTVQSVAACLGCLIGFQTKGLRGLWSNGWPLYLICASHGTRVVGFTTALWMLLFLCRSSGMMLVCFDLVLLYLCSAVAEIINLRQLMLFKPWSYPLSCSSKPVQGDIYGEGLVDLLYIWASSMITITSVVTRMMSEW